MFGIANNASNNKSIISGQTSLIFNPPSAYAVARRDAPKVAEQLWTFSSPKGPKGRFDPTGYYYWGIWNFSKNIPAAKALLAHISTREIQEKLVAASVGFDIPPFKSCWAEEGPPKGTNYWYPTRDDAEAQSHEMTALRAFLGCGQEGNFTRRRRDGVRGGAATNNGRRRWLLSHSQRGAD